jgi:Rod binding domain-containing protein
MNPTIASPGAFSAAAFDNATAALDNRASPLDAPRDPRKPEEAAQAFEAFFLSQMLSDMFSGIETDPVFGGGPGETVFRSLMIDEYGKSLARNGGVGIADSVLQEIVRLQEIDTDER